MTPFDYRLIQRQALKLLAVAFALGGLFAVSCGRCDGLVVLASASDLTITSSKWQQVMSVLVSRRIERDKARAEVKLLREQLRIERNSFASKLAARDLEIGRLRKKSAPPTCDGWKISTGVALGVAGVCAVTLTVREVTR